MTLRDIWTLPLALVTVASLAPAIPAVAEMQKIGAPPEAKNMRLVGYDDLQARSTYQPIVVHQGNRYIAYLGHHGGKMPKPYPLTGQEEFNGTSIVDVTDPAHPKYLQHIPGAEGGSENGGAQMVRVCSGAGLPRADRNKFYMLRTFGTKGHEIWDVTDSANPVRLATIGGNYTDTHKSWWECDTGIAYVVSGVPGWRVKRMTEVYDLGDPSKPVKIRDFGLPGQEPGATGAVPTELHGPISMPSINRIYFGYGSSKGGILQIVDREKLLKGPKEPTPENLSYPEIGKLVMYPFVGAHTAFPMLQMPIAEFAKDGVSTRDFVMIIERGHAKRVQAAGARDGLVRRHHQRDPSDDRVELHGEREERRFLFARRPFRRAFLAGRYVAGVLQEARRGDLLQRWRAGHRRARSLFA